MQLMLTNYRYDPNVDIVEGTDTVEERLTFLKSICEVVYYKARVKLNIKRLYQADGYAVKELLKLAKLLNDATILAKSVEESDDYETASLQQLNSSKFQLNVKQIRSIATELTELGAELHELLGKELELKQERLEAISFPHNIETIKEHIEKKNIEAIDMISELQKSINDLKKDEDSLKDKKKRKETELERAKKRLSRVSNFRPAFMDEYEQKETDLQELYRKYVEKYRNIEYLEHELEKHRKAEAEIIEENKRRLKLLRKKLRADEIKYLSGENQATYGDGEDDDDDDDDDEDDEEGDGEDDDDESSEEEQDEREVKSSARPRAASGRRPEGRTTTTATASKPNLNVAPSNQKPQIASRETPDGYDSDEYGESEEESSNEDNEEEMVMDSENDDSF
ncbi:hypothetical protein NAEGRDRAFT_62998 [Naegleria gruberi]|uniref:Clusterin-associated protein 1 n=1 Tax=Naegleria gruberi TaxID=5762 RepID=D2V2H0_NAEGR|nr:uncharacterized protein NAEGRDRAFT_62998 [Naegleria gruberi]EFC48898.1 hypothetical protein NAEGRDRAFT_62998 [Naegleria gruberi]|eukprot:XP_002681642.1 hypothetical protein NAEGRDRAFT_62998 [Naegleria gruberi strain NEG-M]